MDEAGWACDDIRRLSLGMSIVKDQPSATVVVAVSVAVATAGAVAVAAFAATGGGHVSELDRFCEAAAADADVWASGGNAERASALARVERAAPRELRPMVEDAARGEVPFSGVFGDDRGAAGPVDVDAAVTQLADRNETRQAWSEVAEVLAADCDLEVLG